MSFLSGSGRVLSWDSPTVLTPASPEFHLAWLTIAELLRLVAVRSARRGSPSPASRPEPADRTHPALTEGE